MSLNYAQFLQQQKKQPKLSKEENDLLNKIIIPNKVEITYPVKHTVYNNSKISLNFANLTMEEAMQKIDIKTSFIIEDIPYMLITTLDDNQTVDVHRIYFINFNIFKAYKPGKKISFVPPCTMTLFDLFGVKGTNKLFLGVGNYRHISFLVPQLLVGKNILKYSLRMNGKLFKALEPIKKVVYSYKFKKEKYEIK